MDVSDHYKDGSYAAKHPTWHAERSTWKAQQVANLIDKAKLQPKSILDIGCGVGECLLYLTERYQCGASSLGIEPSPDVQPSTAAQAANLTITKQTLNDVNSHFDLAIMLDVFEHVDDYLGFLRQAKGKADWYAFHIPLDIYAIRVLAGRMLTSRKQHGHLHYFTLETALATLKEAGFTIDSWRFTPAAFDGPNRNPYTPRNLISRIGYRLCPKLISRTIGGYSLAVLAR